MENKAKSLLLLANMIRMNAEVLQEIENIGLEVVYKQLLAYSSMMLSKAIGKDEVHVLPADIVASAIGDALSEKEWNKDEFPTIMEFLKNLCINGCRRVYRKNVFSLRVSNDIFSEETIQAKVVDPVDLIDADNLKNEMKSLVVKKKKSIDDFIVDIFDARLAGYTNIEIAEYLSIDIKTVENQMKVIKRCIKPLRDGR